MEENLKKIIACAIDEVSLINKEADLLNLKAKYLGKSSVLNGYLMNLKNMSIDDKKKYGKLLNEIKNELESIFTSKINEINSKSDINFDDTLPSYSELGSMHPITIVGHEV